MVDLSFDQSIATKEYINEKLNVLEANMNKLQSEHRKLLGKILEVIAVNDFKDEYVFAMLLQSTLLKRDSKFKESFTLIEKMEEYVNQNQLSTSSRIRVFSAYTYTYIEQGDVTKALFYAERALKLSREINDNRQVHMQLFRIGVINLIAENNETALRYFLEDLEYLENIDVQNRMNITLNNIGVALNHLGKTEEAKPYLKRSIEISKEINDESCEAASMDEIASIYLKEENYVVALEYIKLSLNLFIKQNYHYDAQAVKVQLLKALRMTNALDEYEKVMKSLEKEVETYDFTEVKAKFYEETSYYYKEKDDYKKAYHHIIKAQELSESYKASNVQNELKQFETKTVTLLNEKLKVIGDIGRKISSSRSMSVIFDELTALLNDLLSFDALGVAMIENKNIINYKYFIEDGVKIKGTKKRTDDESNLGAWAVRNKLPILIYNLEDEKEKYTKGLSYIASTGVQKVMKSVIYVPLMIEDEVVGLLTVQSFERSRYNQEQLELIEIIASYVAVALENIKQSEYITLQNQKLKQVATTDALTGLYNRYYFNEKMQKMWNRAKKESKTIGLILFDLDYFKAINDTYSHVAGDLTLKKIGEVLVPYNTEYSFVSRIGGEEFAVSIYNTSKDEVIRIAEKVRKEIDSATVEYEESVIKISASLGCGIDIPKISDFESFDKLYSRVDHNLYQAKEEGKNRVVYR